MNLRELLPSFLAAAPSARRDLVLVKAAMATIFLVALGLASGCNVPIVPVIKEDGRDRQADIGGRSVASSPEAGAGAPRASAASKAAAGAVSRE